MFTTEQYRAKAIEYRNLLSTANDPDAVREFQRLERSFTVLADNAQWVTDNHAKIMWATEPATMPLTSESPTQSSS